MVNIGEYKLAVVNLLLLLAFVILIAYFTVHYAPLITELVSEPDQFRELIQSYGKTGVFVFIAFQVLQVVISVIPGEVVQITGGYIYGVWLGTLYLVIGLLIGSVLAFYCARLLGYPLLKVLLPKAKFNKFWTLLRSKKFEAVVFLLFLVPGLPKDIFTYAAGLTSVPPAKFFLIATGARFPALIGSVYIGTNLQEENYLTVIILMGGAILLFLIGYFSKDRIIDHLHQWNAARERPFLRKRRKNQKVALRREKAKSYRIRGFVFKEWGNGENRGERKD
jgi:uncharacterized membrane protein YdjX (TVP38/TMEM64 family)